MTACCKEIFKNQYKLFKLINNLSLFQMQKGIKHSRQCYIIYLNTLNFIKNTLLHVVVCSSINYPYLSHKRDFS